MISVSFLWGYLVHRNQIFPYKIFRNSAIHLGIIHPEPQGQIEIQGNVASDLDMLRSLGYVDGVYDKNLEESGVVFMDKTRAFPGPRLYTSVTSDEAHLIDVNGNPLQTWSYPSRDPTSFVHLLDGGDLLMIERYRSLIRLGRDSTVRWTLPIRPHHDLDVWNDTIYVLTREEGIHRDINRHHKIADDLVSLVSLEGEVLSKISLLEIVTASEYGFLQRSVNDFRDDRSETEKDRPLCLMHANHVEVVDGSENWPFGRSNEPQILISMRNINVVMTVELKSREISWIWGPNNLVYPHHPSLLSNDNVLLFDNGLEHSEVLEIDPSNFEIVWRYTEEGFFSKTRGSAQRLPNGNTLITESNKGRVFEVATNGDIVWDFKNPDVAEDGLRGAIFRMTALEGIPKWLD